MNTKTDQISSGLVALAWLDSNADMSDEAFLWDKDSSTGHVEAVVRLSDAEAIIAAKDAEIAAWKNDAINGGNAGYLREVAEHQAERIKELETQFKQTHEWLCDRNQQIHEQSAALKLARQVLMSVKETSSSTRLRRIADEPLAAIHEVLGEVK